MPKLKWTVFKILIIILEQLLYNVDTLTVMEKFSINNTKFTDNPFVRISLYDVPEIKKKFHKFFDINII